MCGYMYYPPEEFGFDIAKDHPAIGAWLERIKAIAGLGASLQVDARPSDGGVRRKAVCFNPA